MGLHDQMMSSSLHKRVHPYPVSEAGRFCYLELVEVNVLHFFCSTYAFSPLNPYILERENSYFLLHSYNHCIDLQVPDQMRQCSIGSYNIFFSRHEFVLNRQ